MSVAAIIEQLNEVNPAAVRLAEAVSFAVKIDRALLRAARLRLVPEADAGAEADLWFSALVQSRSADGIVLDPGVAEKLREAMPAARKREVWAVTSKEHAWLPPSLKIEEEIAYYSVSDEPTAKEELARRLQSVLAAMVSGGRNGLAQWATRALAMFPSAVHALPESKMIETGARLRLGERLTAEPEAPLPSWIAWVTPESTDRVPVGISLRERELEISTDPTEAAFSIPATNPLILEVSWQEGRRRRTRQVTFRRGETPAVPVGRGELRLRTIAGDEYELRERDYVPENLREHIIDNRAEMARHEHLIGRDSELAMLRSGIVQGVHIRGIIGPAGIGKTSLLCGLIRAVAPQSIVITHFFTFPNSHSELVRVAEKSLIAQLAIHFQMREDVLDMRLADVIERLALQRNRPEELLIALDDVDRARIERFGDFPNALDEMFPRALPKWVRLVATSRDDRFLAPFIVLAPLRASEIGDLLQTPNEALDERAIDLSGGNPGYAVVVNAFLRTGRPMPATIEEFLAALQNDDELRLLAVARDPLPARIFKLVTPSAQLLGEFGITIARNRAYSLPDFLRTFIADHESFPAQAHRRLINLLNSSLDDPDVVTYYYRHAAHHLLRSAQTEQARDLCFDVTFIREKIAREGVFALNQDLASVRDALPNQPLLHRTALAIFEESQRLEEAPPGDIPAILYTALLNHGNTPAEITGLLKLPPLPLAPMRRVREPALRLPRRHDEGIIGSALVTIPFSPSQPVDKFLATWSTDGTVKLWERNRAAAPLTLDHDAAVTFFTASDSTGVAASADAGGVVKIWDLLGQKHQLVRASVHAGGVDGILLNASSTLVVTWSGTDPVRLWSIDRPAHRLTPAGALEGHTGPLISCVFLAGEQLILGASGDGSCHLWNRSTLQRTSMVELSGPPTALAYHWRSQSVLVTNARRTMDVINVGPKSLSLLAHGVESGHTMPITGAAISPDEKFGATWSEDQTIRLWSNPLTNPIPAGVLAGHRGAVTDCKFLDRSPWLVSASADGTARVWNFSTQQQLRRLEAHIRPIRTVAVDEDRIFTAGDDRMVKEWDAPTSRELADYTESSFRAAALIPFPGSTVAMIADTESAEPQSATDETMFGFRKPVIGTGSEPGSIFVCPTDSNAVCRSFAEGGEMSLAVPLQLDSQISAATSKGTTFAVGTSEGTILHRPLNLFIGRHAARVSALAFASDRDLLVSASFDGTLAVWDSKTGEQRHHIVAHQSRILCLAVAAGGRAVTGSGAGTIRIWNLETGGMIHSLRAHSAEVTGCWLDDSYLVSWSLDHTLMIHSAAGDRQRVARGHFETITGVAVDRTRGALYSCSEDRTVRQWSLDTGEQTGILYGTAPFRCLGTFSDLLAAGDDAGNVWRISRRSGQTKVFLSWRRGDERFADRLRNDLRREGITIEPTGGMTPGDNVAELLIEKLRSATHLCAILSAETAKSERVRQEIEMARSAGLPVIPLPIDNIGYRDASQWQLFDESESVDFTGWQDETRYRQSLSQLLALLGGPDARSREADQSQSQNPLP